MCLSSYCKNTIHQSINSFFQYLVILTELGDLVKQAMDGLSQMKTMDSNSSEELGDLRILYKKECLQRKLLYNKVSGPIGYLQLVKWTIL